MSRIEYLDSTSKEIKKLWKSHCEFNGWTLNENDNKSKKKKVFINQLF